MSHPAISRVERISKKVLLSKFGMVINKKLLKDIASELAEKTGCKVRPYFNGYDSLKKGKITFLLKMPCCGNVLIATMAGGQPLVYEE